MLQFFITVLILPNAGTDLSEWLQKTTHYPACPVVGVHTSCTKDLGSNVQGAWGLCS